MMNGSLKNCPDCRNVKCTCPKGIGKSMTNTEQISKNELVMECMYLALDQGGELSVPTVQRAIEYALSSQKQQILNAVEKMKKEARPNRDYTGNEIIWAEYDGFINAMENIEELFQPIVELKENETEFERMPYTTDAYCDQCDKCKKMQVSDTNNFCSNCGRKRVDK